MKDFKVRCVMQSPHSYRFTTGKIYRVENGTIIDDVGGYECRKFNSAKDLNNCFASKFELVEENEMTKDDLKVGYVVEYRDGDLRMVMPSEEGMVVINGTNWNPLKKYKDDLTFCYQEHFSIDKVYGFNRDGRCSMNVSTTNRPLLWERKESPVEITIEEIAKKFNVSPDRIRIKE